MLVMNCVYISKISGIKLEIQLYFLIHSHLFNHKQTVEIKPQFYYFNRSKCTHSETGKNRTNRK